MGESGAMWSDIEKAIGDGAALARKAQEGDMPAHVLSGCALASIACSLSAIAMMMARRAS